LGGRSAQKVENIGKITLICFDCGKEIALLPGKKDDKAHYMFVVPCECSVVQQNTQADRVNTIPECPVCHKFHEDNHGHQA